MISNRTKIVATIGPSTNTKESIKQLMERGVAVFRLNFSHGEHGDKAQIIAHIKELNESMGLSCAILADLSGPKIRLGTIENDRFEVERGDKLSITTKDCKGDNQLVHITYDKFPRDVNNGDVILIDDGKVEAKVLRTNSKDTVEIEFLVDGVISSKKGVNLPDTEVSSPALTDKDVEDLEFVLDQGVDWIALSFVRSPKDVQHLRSILEYKGHETKIIAKIEKPQAIEHIDGIIKETDGIMIARGDLGVEVPMETVPLIQKEIVTKCTIASKPVIIATQMMETMIDNSKPTRAEVTDVANAIVDGADAVMLSGETAVGQYPNEVIEMIQKIILNVEDADIIYNKNLRADPDSESFLSDAICYNACRLADSIGANAIIGMTRSGYTAFMTSSYRPKAPIYIFSDHRPILNTLNLVWGVKGFYYDKMVGTDETIFDVLDVLKAKGHLKTGDVVVNLASMPIHRQGRTNMVKITKVS